MEKKWVVYDKKRSSPHSNTEPYVRVSANGTIYLSSFITNALGLSVGDSIDILFDKEAGVLGFLPMEDGAMKFGDSGVSGRGVLRHMGLNFSDFAGQNIPATIEDGMAVVILPV